MNTNELPVLDCTDINKTIVITYDESTRMIDSCKDSEGNVSKDYYDWYLKDKPDLFTKTGMLIVDNILGKGQRCAIAFDFTDPDEVIFTAYVYKDQTVICSWVFRRHDNMTMKNVSFDIKFLSLNNLKKNDLLCPPDLKNIVNDIVNDTALNEKYNKPGFRTISKKGLVQKTLNKGLKEINKINCSAFIYTTYALMYYVTKQTPEEITTAFNKELDVESGKGTIVKSIYKYTGYIDLRESKVYKPIVKKDPNEPVREYERHIQKWTVRGHYRKTKNGIVWIEPHTKGQGELEKRIYSTEDEKDLNIRPKVFEVERTVKEKNHAKIITEQRQEENPVELIKAVPIIAKQKKVGIFRKLLKLFGW